MESIIELARAMADRHPTRHVLIASLGEGARLAAEAFRGDYLVHAIGNVGGDADAETAASIERLGRAGVHVHLLPHSLFQAVTKGGRYTSGDAVYTFTGDSFHGLTLDSLIAKARTDAYSGVFQVLYQTLQSLFSDGPRMCVEIALMAADAGVIPTDEDIISIDRPMPESNCPHAAMLLRPSTSQDLLNSNRFRVKQLITVPGYHDRWFTDGHIWSG